MKSLLVIMLLTVPSLSFATPEIKGYPNELEGYLNGIAKVVTISAESSDEVTSSKAIVKLLVETENILLSEALKENAKIRGSIGAKLKASGFKVEDIKESKFSSTPEFGMFGESPKSYKVRNTITVTVRSEDHVEVVAKISDDSTKIRYLSCVSEIENEDAIRSRLLSKALKIANEKAKIYEDGLGVKLKPVSFEEQSTNAPLMEGLMIQQNKVSNFSSYSSPSTQQKVSFGVSSFNLTVSVKYQLISGI